jgi:hypothetical protein
MYSARIRVTLNPRKIRRSFDFTVSIVRVVKLSFQAGLSFFYRLLTHHNCPSQTPLTPCSLAFTPSHKPRASALGKPAILALKVSPAIKLSASTLILRGVEKLHHRGIAKGFCAHVIGMLKISIVLMLMQWDLYTALECPFKLFDIGKCP